MRARIIAEPSTGVAEFESGNIDVLPDSGEPKPRDWEADESRKPMLMSTPGAAARVHRHQHHARPAHRCARATGDQLRDRRRSHHRAADQRTRDARRRRRAAGARRIRQRRRAYPYDPDKAKALLAAAGHPNGIDIELWTSVTPIYLRIAETIQAYLNRVGIRTKIVQRESAAARGAARKGQTDMILKDWYADYPDAEDFLYPLLHSANKGAGGNVVVLRESNVRLRSCTASRRGLDESEAQSSCIAKRTRSRSIERADGVSLLL